MRICLALLAALTLIVSGCSRPPSDLYTYFKDNVSEADVDRHVQMLEGTDGVREVTFTHDSTNKVVLQLYVNAEEPYEAKEVLRDLGYTRVRD